MEKVAFKEQYSKVKVQLPPYESLAEFDLDNISGDCTSPVKEVSKKIFERLDTFRKILESILQPESTVSMEEAGFLSDKEQEDITVLLRKLMQLDRELLLAELENTDEEHAKFINRVSKEWPSLKKELRPICKQLRECWTKPNNIKQIQHYLG